jgi:hypothetical protein
VYAVCWRIACKWCRAVRELARGERLKKIALDDLANMLGVVLR